MAKPQPKDRKFSLSQLLGRRRNEDDETPPEEGSGGGAGGGAPLEIGAPTGFTRGVHVSHDRETNSFKVREGQNGLRSAKQTAWDDCRMRYANMAMIGKLELPA
jgi:hypothetical protein